MIKKTKEGFVILIGEDGHESLFINSDRITECINYLHSNNLRFITINSFQNYKSKNIDFLFHLKDYLEGLSVLDTYYDYGIINELYKLKYLGIPDNGKDVIDLRNFPDLETCGLAYSVRLQGLESCINLKSLTLSNYKPKVKNLSALQSLTNLVHLSLIKTDITSLLGIECFRVLRHFEIFGDSKLESLAALLPISNSIEKLQIEKCKNIRDFEMLGSLKSLKKIIISESGEINTLSFIKELPLLEFISFWGTTVLDGNIAYCKGLNYVGFDNKKHYTDKLEDFN